MPASSSSDLFKFHYIVGGRSPSMFAKKGVVANDCVILGKDELPYHAIVETVARGNRVALRLSAEFAPAGELAKRMSEDRLVVLQPKRLSARALETAIDRKCSIREAERRRQELVSQGLGHQVRTEACPICRSTVDLSGLEPTEYTYCRFCQTIFSADRSRVTDGNQYRTCDECGLFDRIQSYPEFYFYFLLVVYGASYKRRYLCDGCAHRLFLKALALNLLFVLGVPTAIWVKVKSLRGRDPSLAALARANALARAGRYQEASPRYQEVLRAHPNHPGVLLDEAIGHLNGRDEAAALELLNRSVSACNHYLPVLRLLRVSGAPPA